MAGWRICCFVSEFAVWLGEVTVWLVLMATYAVGANHDDVVYAHHC